MRDAKTNPPLRQAYQALVKKWGAQSWWPAQDRFEVMVGAILTQNTAWTNVEKAIANLRQSGLLTPLAIHNVTLNRLAEVIRPAGTFNVKAKRIKNFTAWLVLEHSGSIDSVFEQDADKLRNDLLTINGIGEETADCILLYAGGIPVFVVDAYTRRILHRHGWADDTASYGEIASLFEQVWTGEPLSTRARICNEYHALLVKLAKEHCRSTPDCGECPLKKWTPVSIR